MHSFLIYGVPLNPFRTLEKTIQMYSYLWTRAAFQETIITVHTVSLQWIPSYCSLRGNEIANKAAMAVHYQASPTSVPFTWSDGENFVRRLGKEMPYLLWANPQYHYKTLRDIDPSLTF